MPDPPPRRSDGRTGHQPEGEQDPNRTEPVRYAGPATRSPRQVALSASRSRLPPLESGRTHVSRGPPRTAIAHDRVVEQRPRHRVPARTTDRLRPRAVPGGGPHVAPGRRSGLTGDVDPESGGDDRADEHPGALVADLPTDPGDRICFGLPGRLEACADGVQRPGGQALVQHDRRFQGRVAAPADRREAAAASPSSTARPPCRREQVSLDLDPERPASRLALRSWLAAVNEAAVVWLQEGCPFPTHDLIELLTATLAELLRQAARPRFLSQRQLASRL